MVASCRLRVPLLGGHDTMIARNRERPNPYVGCQAWVQVWSVFSLEARFDLGRASSSGGTKDVVFRRLLSLGFELFSRFD